MRQNFPTAVFVPAALARLTRDGFAPLLFALRAKGAVAFACATKAGERCGLAIAALLVSPDASAYLDPSTGSMVVTALVGIFASVALALKTWWYRLKSLFRRSSRQRTAGDKDPPHVD